jgi:hypothetical protein
MYPQNSDKQNNKATTGVQTTEEKRSWMSKKNGEENYKKYGI